jgi:anti-sigma regulatory factor (Ser/Thr protein kinase)
MKRPQSDVDALILANVEAHPDDLVSHVAGLLSVTPRMVLKHVARLVAQGRISSTGRTKGRRYGATGLAPGASAPTKSKVIPQVSVESLRKYFAFPVSSSLHEDDVWRSYIAPELSDLPDNVQKICQHGLTEMINNVIDHSEASVAGILLNRAQGEISLSIYDDGIGVFEKIRKAMGLADYKDASLELYKGKFTTDPARHSGEGIFFTSRAFDKFALSANGCVWTRIGGESADAETPELENFKHDAKDIPPEIAQGTSVTLRLGERSTRRLKDVFDAGSADPKNDFAFDKTSFPLAAAQTATGPLVSRSQAKRVLARLENFKAVELDFAGVAEIGQAFADEIFRVFRAAHPGVALTRVNAAPEVERMIRRAAP